VYFPKLLNVATPDIGQVPFAIELTSEAPPKKYLTPDIGQALGS